jgi:tRNA (guanine-N7-)-methyltransferase
MSLKPEFAERLAARRADLRSTLVQLFPAPQSIVWEVGCGHGHFLARYAGEFPQKTCVGVDFSSQRIGRSRRKSDRALLTNCPFLRAEGREFLETLPAGVTFGEIWVLFPDPWPKKRHHKNRILQPGFFEALAARTQTGAALYFRTDHTEYFAAVSSFLAGLDTWRPDPAAGWPLEPETVFQARAPTFHSLVAVRTSHPARPGETAAAGLPVPAGPKSPA